MKTLRQTNTERTMIFKYLKKRRERRNQEIARAVSRELKPIEGWDKFLPPVVVRDKVYMITERGTVYRMNCDTLDGFETVVRLHQ